MKKNQNTCTGHVRTLRGQVAIATGKVSIRGVHTLREAIYELLEEAGARVATGMSGQVSLLIHGDLSG